MSAWRGPEPGEPAFGGQGGELWRQRGGTFNLLVAQREAVRGAPLEQRVRREQVPRPRGLASLRREASPALVRAVKLVLRHEDVRECAEHYVGSRGKSVRRQFANAGYVMPDADGDA